MAQLGKCARATPRQAAGRLARGSADLGLEFGLTKRRTLPFPDRAECAFPSRCDRRMRLSVRVLAQNALFRRMHLSSPGQTWRRLTEKHILQPTPHGKAHSAIPRSRRMRLSVTPRRPGGVGQPPRQAAGHYGECLNWANALEQPPASLRGGLREGPQISVWV